MTNAQGRRARLNGIGSMATCQFLTQMTQQYRNESGRHVDATSTGGVEAARRVQAGEPFDFAILASGAIDRLIGAGHLVGRRVDVVRSRAAVAVRQGASRPDIGSSSALRQTVLHAGRIGYSTGPSGDHLLALFARWGVSDELAPRLVQAPPGMPVGRLIAEGKVELGFQQQSELMTVDGVEVLGPLPDDVQLMTVFSAGVCAVSGRIDAARHFLSFLTSASADAAKRLSGMEPVRGADIDVDCDSCYRARDK
ncbi:substrate-binding domain-containing protein [Paraburkholderia tropica]|uniref:substrate-binding domain-containing protein n=1 Tax=Paraburkholderia tropica TaxID=92647 RepID=UPI002AB168EB|nr:substrate-binding domain-containing protein [Paraburkholderia tropica]